MRREKADPELRKLLIVANAGGELTLTLSIPGCVVSGRLISVKTYHQLRAKLYGAAHSGEQSEPTITVLREDQERLASTFEQDADRLSALNAQNEKDEELSAEEQEEREMLEEHLYGYIHLADAALLVDSHMVGQRVGLWRGRVRQVAGFMLGELSKG